MRKALVTILCISVLTLSAPVSAAPFGGGLSLEGWMRWLPTPILEMLFGPIGPELDPNGTPQSETDYGPDLDPNGAPSAEGDYGPDFDPDGQADS